MSIRLIYFFPLYQIIVKCCNLKELKHTKSVVVFVFLSDDTITQEKIQKETMIIIIIFFLRGGGDKLPKFSN